MGFRTFSEEPTAESAPSSVPTLALQSANPAEAGDTEEAPAGGGAGDDLADLRTRAEVRGTTVYASDALPLGDIEGISAS